MHIEQGELKRRAHTLHTVASFQHGHHTAAAYPVGHLHNLLRHPCIVVLAHPHKVEVYVVFAVRIKPCRCTRIISVHVDAPRSPGCLQGLLLLHFTCAP